MLFTLKSIAAYFLLGCLVSSALAADETVAKKPAGDPLRPPAIATEEVPPVPPALMARLNQYQSTRAAGFAGWSPDGKGMLVNTRLGNTLQLHRVYTPGGRREQITFFQEPVSGGFIPKDKTGRIIAQSSAGGSENTQLTLVDTAKYQTRLLTDGKSRYSLGAIRHDGSQLIVNSNERNGRDMDLYVWDTTFAGKPELLMQADGKLWYAADWSKDGKKLLLVNFVSANLSKLALFDVEKKERTEIPLPDGKSGAINVAAFAPGDKEIYLGTDVGGEFLQLALVELASGKHRWLTSEIPWSVNDLEIDEGSGKLAFTVNENGSSALYLMEPAGKPQKVSLPVGIVMSLDFSPDGKELGFTLARPDAPADAYSLRLADQHLERWTFSETGGLDPASFIAATPIKFPSFDKREIPAWIYRPRATEQNKGKKFPVLIDIHGGPESQSRPYFSGKTQFLVNELGVVVIYPNVRGSAGYGKTYLTLDDGMKREDSVRDIGALLDWIAAQPDLDSSRVAVSGGSYGGYMVLASLVHFGDRIKAGMDAVGVANFITFLEGTAAYRQDLRRVEYGDERDPAMRAFLIKISPANQADKIRSALLVSHGKNDPRVPIGEAMQVAANVRKQGRPVWTVYAENEGHGFAKKDNRDYLTAVEILFLQKNLLGD